MFLQWKRLDRDLQRYCWIASHESSGSLALFLSIIIFNFQLAVAVIVAVAFSLVTIIIFTAWRKRRIQKQFNCELPPIENFDDDIRENIVSRNSIGTFKMLIGSICGGSRRRARTSRLQPEAASERNNATGL